MPDERLIIETTRLRIRRASTAAPDINLLYRLWTDPQVMTPVGYPQGLRITREEIQAHIASEIDSEFNNWLMVVEKESGLPIGECKLGLPDDTGVSETDVKLIPACWRRGYGTEIKRALVDYLFTHTDCRAVKATPNKNNIASQKMQ